MTKIILAFAVIVAGVLQAESFVYGPTNAPDPFNYGPGPVPAATRINLEVTKSTDVRIEIYDKPPNTTRLINRFYSDRPGSVTLSTTWNGVNDANQELTNGTYTARARLQLSLVPQLSIAGSGVTFNEPSDAAMDNIGNLYVVNAGNRTVQKFNPGGILLLFDFETRGSTNMPKGIAVDSSGNIYVANTEYGTVEKYDSAGVLIASNWATGLTRPSGMASDASNIYIADEAANRIYKARIASGGAVTVTATPGTGNNGFVEPQDVAVASDGTLYIVGKNGQGKFLIFRHNAAGAHVNNVEIEPQVSAPGYLSGVAVDAQNNVYATFTGALGPPLKEAYFRKFTATLANGTPLQFGSFGSGNDQFKTPLGISAYYDSSSASTFVFVLDAGNSRVQRIRDNGVAFTYVSTIKEDDYNVLAPNDAGVDSSGNVYVACEKNHVVKVFDPAGSYVATLGSYGTTAGYFNRPQGVAVDRLGRVYVSDLGSQSKQGRVQIFSNNAFVRTLVGPINNKYPRGLGVDTNNNVYTAWLDGQVYRNAANWVATGTSAEDVFIDYKGDAYVASTTGGRIYRYNSAGTAQGSVLTTGGTPQIGIAGDWFGDIVCSMNSNLFRYNNGLLTRLGTYPGGGLSDPQGLAFSPDAGYLWVAEKNANRLRKFRLVWSEERTDPMTIQDTNSPPTVNNVALSGSGVRFLEGVYYARAGQAAFTVSFSENMNTASNVSVKYVVNGHEYEVVRTSFAGNTWIGTCSVVSGDDGNAVISVRNGRDSGNTLMDPHPNTEFGFVIDTTPPAAPIVTQPGSPTSLKIIQVSGSAEQNITVHVYNHTKETGGSNISWQSNVIVNSSGSWLANSVTLLSANPPRSNWIWAVAVDKAGNVSPPSSPRRFVYYVDPSAGSGYITPSDNAYLGRTTGPPWEIHYIVNSYMSNGTMTMTVPEGWASPSTNSGSAGWVRISSYSSMTLEAVPLACTNRILKLSFKRAVPGAEVVILYGRTDLLAVSNHVVIGVNSFSMRAANNDPAHGWYPADTIVPISVGQALDITVLGDDIRVGYGDSLPERVYRGQSSVTAMTLILRNPNGGGNHVDLTVLRLRTGNSNNEGINANAALSRIRITDGTSLYRELTSIPDNPTVNVDLSSFPVPVDAGTVKRIIVLLDIAENATSRSLKINLASAGDLTVRDRASGTALGVTTNAPQTLPIQTGRALILSNAPAVQVLASLEAVPQAWAEANRGYTTAARLVFSSTNTDVNDAKITELSLVFRTESGAGLVPSSWLRGVRVQRTGEGPVYLQDTTMEGSGESVWLDLAANPVFVPNMSSVTLGLKVSLLSNIATTNFQIHLLSTNAVTARDKILNTHVSVKPASGVSFPMSAGVLQVVRYFRIEHDGSANENVWEPITLRAWNANRSLVTNFDGTVTLSASGIAGTLGWTNIYTAAGVLTDAGDGSGRAVYAFSSADKGSAQLGFRSDTTGTVELSIYDAFLSGFSNNLVISAVQPPDVRLSKTSVVSNSASYLARGGGLHDVVPGAMISYTIRYSNHAPTKASNVLLRDRLPAEVMYVPGSIVLDGLLQTDALDGADLTDFGVTMTNTVTSTLRSLPGGGGGSLHYRVIIR